MEQGHWHHSKAASVWDPSADLGERDTLCCPLRRPLGREVWRGGGTRRARTLLALIGGCWLLRWGPMLVTRFVAPGVISGGEYQGLPDCPTGRNLAANKRQLSVFTHLLTGWGKAWRGASTEGKTQARTPGFQLQRGVGSQDNWVLSLAWGAGANGFSGGRGLAPCQGVELGVGTPGFACWLFGRGRRQDTWVPISTSASDFLCPLNSSPPPPQVLIVPWLLGRPNPLAPEVNSTCRKVCLPLC